MICPPWHKHGATLTCYKHHRCRCAHCRSANSGAGRAQRAGVPWRIPDPYAVDAAVAGNPVDFLTTAQRAEAVKVLWLQRWSDAAIAERLGFSDRTVLRIRQRHGWRAWQMHEQQKRKETPWS